MEAAAYTASDVPQTQAPETSGSELLVMTVEIGDGRQDIISIRDGDKPEQLAKEFARKHGLDQKLQRNLTILIQQNKDLAELRVVTHSAENSKWAECFASSQASPVTEPATKKSSVSYAKHSGSVFERLYSQGRKPAPGKPGNQRTKSASFINYGEWMYTRGMQMREQQERKIEAFKKQQDAELAAEKCSFSPVIDEYSKLLSPRYFEKTEELLMRKAASYQERLEELKAKAHEDEMKECSFNPKTLRKPGTPNKGRPKHEELYSLAETRRQKRLALSQTASQLNSAVRPVRKTMQELEAVADRLVNFKKGSDAKVDRMREDAVQSSLLDNGKPLFHPTTLECPGRAVSSIHEYLYNKRTERPERLAKILEASAQNWRSVASQQKTCANSEQLYDQLRGKQYALLFSLMDSDADGKISAEAVCLDYVDVGVLQLLTPLFNAMDTGTEFSLADFVSHMETLWQTFNVEQRRRFYQRPPKQEEPSSIEFAKPATMPEVTIYERTQNSRRITALKQEKIKELDAAASMKECTFSPTIKKLNKKRRA